MDYEAAERAADAAGGVQRKALERADRLSAVFTSTARALETSAALAEEHAARRERGGHADEATRERLIAARASDAARRARVRAAELLELSSPR